MHWKSPLFTGLAALVGLTGALPAYSDGAKTGLVAMSSNLAGTFFIPSSLRIRTLLTNLENATAAEYGAQLVERETPPLDWGSQCPWWPYRTPGSVLGNEGNKLNLKSDCSFQERGTYDVYTIHTDVDPSLHEKSCACQYFHYFLRRKLMSVVEWQRPICVSWNHGKGMEISLEAYIEREGSMNQALEELYGYKSTCRRGFPKSVEGF